MAFTDVSTTQDEESVSDVIMLEAIPETADVVEPPDARHQPSEGRPAVLSEITSKTAGSVVGSRDCSSSME
jgi:hypothetical protein